MRELQMKKILVLLPNNLGDVIMALPMLLGLKKQEPSCRITFLVENGYDGGLLNSPYCDDIKYLSRVQIREFMVNGDCLEGISLLRELINSLNSNSFTHLINLGQHTYLSYITALIVAENKYGNIMLREGNMALKDLWSQYLYAIPFARNFNRLHVSDVYKRIAGVNESVQSVITVTQAEHAAIHEYLGNKIVDREKKIVIFQPGAAYASKRWPVQHFVSLGKMLINDGYQIVITGAPSESDIAQGLADQLDKKSIVTCGELTFRETVALVSFAHFCVTGDTATMHVASSLGKKVFALFGPTNPVETGPYGDGNFIFAGRCTTRPCFCTECKSMLCMKSIFPETVHAVIRGNVPMDTSCDIFKTRFSDTGDYMIELISGNGKEFYTDTGAQITQRFFENRVLDLPCTDEFILYKNETMEFCRILLTMEETLDCFIEKNDIQAIVRFESLKKEFMALKGISEFWTALFNIQINSIPLLNIRNGVLLYRRTCMEFRMRLENIFDL
jgi:ADP-heptose:LPS heptosyltransferase